MLKTIGGKYWDINDFLCEEEKIVCKFECDSYQMSELDSNQGLDYNDDIKKGFIIEMPLWLGVKMSQASFVQIEMP